MRGELRDRILGSIAQGDLPVSDEWLEEVLTPASVDAMVRLAQQGIELPQLPSSPQDGDSDAS